MTASRQRCVRVARVSLSLSNATSIFLSHEKKDIKFTLANMLHPPGGAGELPVRLPFLFSLQTRVEQNNDVLKRPASHAHTCPTVSMAF